jgi:hypothetical protein
MMLEPRLWNEGIALSWSFPNGYGASVVRHSGSYGNKSGLWELAVTHGPSVPSHYGPPLCYATKITSDVLGWQEWADIAKHLDSIAALPENPMCRHKSPAFNG